MPSTAKRFADSDVRLCSAERQFLENFVHTGQNHPLARPDRTGCTFFKM